MKVTLIRKAEYDLKTDGGGLTAIPNEVFNTIVGLNEERFDAGVHEHCREVAFFEDRNDYIARAAQFDIDPNEPVYVNKKGNVLTFLKEACPDEAQPDREPGTASDATTASSNDTPNGLTVTTDSTVKQQFTGGDDAAAGSKEG